MIKYENSNSPKALEFNAATEFCGHREFGPEETIQAPTEQAPVTKGKKLFTAIEA